MNPHEMAAIHAAAFSQSRPWSADEFAEFLAQPAVFACESGQSFALVRVIADEAELLTIATHPSVQREGRARELMHMWQSEAVRRGAQHAFLEVAADNSAAQHLYLSCGFVQAGLRKDYYARAGGRAADAVIMTRDLTQG